MSATRQLGYSEAELDPPLPIPDGSRSQVYSSLRRRLIAGDAVAAALAWSIPSLLPGSLVASRVSSGTATDIAIAAGSLMVAVVFTLAVLSSERLYRARVCAMRTVEIARVARASLVVGTVALVMGKFLGEEHLARVPLLTVALTFIFLNLWRSIYATWLSNARRNGRFTRPVLLVGSNEEASNLGRVIGAHPELGYRFVGVVGDVRDVQRNGFAMPYVGDVENLDSVLSRSGVKGAIVVGSSLVRNDLNGAIRNLLSHEVHVHLSTGINGIDHRRLKNHSLGYEPLLYVERAQLERWQLMVKRAIDVCLASAVLLLTAPIMAAAIAAIRLHDRGPAMFAQERVGRHGQPFRIYKFRSMVMDAEHQLADLREHNQRQGPLFKLASDPRVTPVGKFLRSTSIDELPQLFNVIRGDMSLVGPRPALSREVAAFDDDLLLARQNVQPGITGLWQVEGRDNPDFAMYQRLDLFYVENWSVALDLSILTSTARVVVGRTWSSVRKSLSRRDVHSETVVLD